MAYRTHHCGELTGKNTDEIIQLSGWVSRRRDHGELIFIDLRDRYGITQIVFEPENAELMKTAKKLGAEFVIQVDGIVRLRPDGMVNSEMKTGEIEIQAQSLSILNEAKTPPFEITDRTSAKEDLRLEYRYLDIRTDALKSQLLLRSKMYKIIRNSLYNLDFAEVETPILMKSTPEGARDFLVPSRLHRGKFYALPQSPQTYKQLLMIGGLDKYFQIVKCFRDEDFRADRQPEFTQIDIEMSFVTAEDVFSVAEEMMANAFKEIKGIELARPFRKMNYQEAMENYGSDKPDLRYDLKIQEFAEFVKKSEFNAFKSVADSGGRVKGLVVPSGAKYSRKVIDGLTDYLKKYYRAKGLAWMKCENDALVGGISKFFADDLQKEIIAEWGISDGDIAFFIGDDESVTLPALGALRCKIAEMENLADSEKYEFLWVVDFPLMEYDSDAERWFSMHHPFTRPILKDLPKFDENPGAVRSDAYDLVLNGNEIAGGSIRIHENELQQKVFDLLKISKEEAEEKFGFLLKALQYGAPPHGGIAFGFDRLVAILAGVEQIREVIAFPKTTSGISLMDDSPSFVDETQLKDLHIKLSDKNG